MSQRSLAKPLLALAMFLLPIVVLEVGLRIFTDHDSRWNVRIGRTKQFDPLTQIRNRPNAEVHPGVWTNERGYLAPKGLSRAVPAGTTRILFLGDSVTFHPLPRNYPTFLAPALEERLGRPVQAVNVAVAGFASHNVRALYESEVRELEADALLLYVGWNDLGQFGPEGLPYKRVASGYTVSPWERILSELYTVRIVYALQRVLRRRQPAFDAPLSAEDEALYAAYYPSHYEENLRAILRDARERYPVVAIANLATLTSARPTKRDLATAHFPIGMDKNLRKLDRLVARYNEVVEKVAAGLAVPLVDLHGAFDSPEARREFTDSCHVTEAGAARIADTFLPVVAPALSPGS